MGFDFHADGVRPIVLLDAVGTLMYPEPTAAIVYHAFGKRLGVEVPLDEIRRRFDMARRAYFPPLASSEEHELVTNDERERRRWREIVGAVFLELSNSLADRLFGELWEYFADGNHWRLFPDVEPALRELSQRGIPWAIASNFDERLERAVQAHVALKEAVAVFHSAKLGICKPAPQFYLQIAARLDAHVTQLWMIGDDPDADFLGARNSGCQALWLNRHQGRAANRIAANRIAANRIAADRTITELHQLTHYLFD
ncbi:MAG: HAD family hydrolase [Pirellulaceae bacterium]|nr:HAD hydrolase-like protein [Planctomycetales bacterium]